MPNDNLFETRQRINAAAQTRKITRTMELVASSRLQRGKQQLAAFEETLAHLSELSRALEGSYFTPREDAPKQKALLIFGGSKGLCGAYTPNLLRYAHERAEGQLLLTAGNAAGEEFPHAYAHFGDDMPSMRFARTLARAVCALYDEGAVGEVHLIYTLGSTPVARRLLPLLRTGAEPEQLILEPTPKALFEALFPAYVEALIYEAHLQAFTAEQVARVAAMDNATRNAGEIIDELQAAYNRIRQASITEEIIMVTGAATVLGD